MVGEASAVAVGNLFALLREVVNKIPPPSNYLCIMFGSKKSNKQTVVKVIITFLSLCSHFNIGARFVIPITLELLCMIEPKLTN